MERAKNTNLNKLLFVFRNLKNNKIAQPPYANPVKLGCIPKGVNLNKPFESVKTDNAISKSAPSKIRIIIIIKHNATINISTIFCVDKRVDIKEKQKQ
jgi:hypothetical protein